MAESYVGWEHPSQWLSANTVCDCCVTSKAEATIIDIYDENKDFTSSDTPSSSAKCWSATQESAYVLSRS